MLTTADINRIKSQITRVLQRHTGISPIRTSTLLPLRGLQGKLYEASVLAEVCEKLVTQEGFTITLSGGTNLMLKQKGGPINRSYPYFKVWRGQNLEYELFTDVYFKTISSNLKRIPTNRSVGDYHELDIALVLPNLNDKPNYDEIALAIECKNTSLKKSIVRELLGFRRELSFLQHQNRTIFTNWPTNSIPANPNSVHMLYCSDNRVSRYIDNCLTFGILLEHYRM